MLPKTSWRSLQAEPELCLRIAKNGRGIEVTGEKTEEVKNFVQRIDSACTIEEIDGRVIIK